MQSKLKTCSGYNGIEHQAIIYKNINGKKYCKQCTMRLQPPKSIKKMSEKGIFRMRIKRNLLEEDKKFYMEVWFKRFFEKTRSFFIKIKQPQCEVCHKYLESEPLLTYFHHILEKRNYPALRHVEKNIAILCPECHNKYETFPDSIPYLVEKRKELLEYYQSITNFLI